MKISELISNLQNIQNTIGDLDVMIAGFADDIVLTHANIRDGKLILQDYHGKSAFANSDYSGLSICITPMSEE